MKPYFVCPVSDPLMLGSLISAPSLDSCLIEYSKLYGSSPCCIYEVNPRSVTRESFLSNLKFVGYYKKSKIQNLINKYSLRT